jgi:hypothetical protein
VVEKLKPLATGRIDDRVRTYNTERPHQGRWCFGKTPMQTFVDTLAIAQEKLLPAA